MNTTTGDRYRLADKAVWRVGYGAMQLAVDGVYGQPRVALAWLLAIADNVLLIPGTRSRGHLTENLAAGSLSLNDDDVASLNTAFSEQ